MEVNRHYDAIVIGAGVCGIIAALELGRAHKSVLLIESGHQEPAAQAQELNQGFTTGDAVTDPGLNRTRAFGGTMHQWEIHLQAGIAGGRFVELEPYDFESKRQNPLSEWPISYEDLKPYYQKAKQYLGVEDLCQGGDPDRKHPLSSYLDPDVLVAGEYGLADFRVLLAQWRKELNDNAHITLLEQHTVTAINLNEQGNRVESVSVLPTSEPDAPTHFYTAGNIVLAAGVIENVRLLLTNTHPKWLNGLGNNSGWVGKGFMDHSIQPVCTVELPPGFDTAKMAFFDRQVKNGGERIGFLTFNENYRRQHELYNLGLILTPVPSWVNSDAGRALRLLKSNKVKGIISCLKQAPGIARLIWAKIRKEKSLKATENGWADARDDKYKHRHHHWMIWAVCEQDSHAENCLDLSKTHDYYGIPRVSVEWSYTKEDQDLIISAKKIVYKFIEQQGLPAIPLAQIHYSGTHHHFGGARMSLEEYNGVTDENGIIHGISNFSLAGCSAACSSGMVNPTLTHLALTLKTLDHLN